MTKSKTKTESGRKPLIPFTKKDGLLLIFLTFIYAVTVLYYLGSKTVPESGYTTVITENREIILNFEEEEYVSAVDVFLGYNSARYFSISSYDEEKSRWTVVVGDAKFQSAMTWNRVDVGASMKYIGFVNRQGEAEIQEMVILDADGNKILPTNADEYPGLFDEQDLYVANATCHDGSMFDEIYHGRTAYEFLNGKEIYETTHPPLGKTLISYGIKWFGMNPFGWRFVCAICGIMMVPIFYLFALAMFEKTRDAAYTTVLLMSGFMNFALARIATIDIIIALFVLCMFFFLYLYVKADETTPLLSQIGILFLGGLSTGLAIATKWTGFYAILGIAVLFFIGLFGKIGGLRGIKSHGKYIFVMALCGILFFVVLPLTIYVFSYVPFKRLNPDTSYIQLARDSADLMLNYHKGVNQSHPYQSKWWMWPFDYKPLVDAYDTDADGMIHCVITFLNPITCLLGLFALGHQIYLAIFKRDRDSICLLIMYISMYAPWIFVTRTVFIYQYFVPSLIQFIMIAKSSRVFKKYSADVQLITGFLAIVLFAIFYPYLSGRPVSAQYVQNFLLWHGWPY